MVAGTTGYGLTESIGAIEGTHHRIRGVISGGFAVADWLALGLSLDGRYDSHPKDSIGADATWVGDPRLLARTGYRLNESFQIGGEIDFWFPGNNAPSLIPGATSVDTKMLASYSPQHIPWTVAALAGFRLDNSARSVKKPSRLRPGDRIALGVSDNNACLVGVGTTFRIDKTELIGELTWDILVGQGAPAATVSPMRVDTGVRYHALASVQLELLTDISLSKRPQLASSSALIPIEPRFSVSAGLRYILNSSRRAQAVRMATVTPKETVSRRGTIRGQLLDPDGGPIEGAHLRLTVGKTVAETTSDASGIYNFEQVPLGNATLHVHANGFEDVDWTVSVVPEIAVQEPRRLTPVMVEPELPVGQLRGLVRSFSGKPVQARVYVEPGGTEVFSDASGRFQIDVPPGTYRISLQARGYLRQKRTVKVEKNGVSIINVDMREVHE
jgi:hypothetical protein